MNFGLRFVMFLLACTQLYLLLKLQQLQGNQASSDAVMLPVAATQMAIGYD